MKLATISTIQTGERVITTARYALTIEREHDNENLFMLGLIDRATGAHIDSGIGYESLASVAGFLRSYVDRATVADMLDSLASGAEDNRRGVYTIETRETSKPYNEEYATSATVVDSLRYVIESLMLRMKPARFEGLRRIRDRSGNLRAVVICETGARHTIRFIEEVTS